MKHRGFILLEFLLYIGIATLVLITSVNFAWTLINDQIKQEQLSKVIDNGSFVLDKTSYYSKRADSLDGQTIYGVHPGKLILNYMSNPQTTIDTYQKEIIVGEAPVIITKLRLREGANPAIDITSDEVDVKNFVVTNMSTVSATVFRINLNLEAINPGASKVYEAQNSWTTSFTLRKR